jgi:4-hydroxythreonine-4-phosphate dehydrogenase
MGRFQPRIALTVGDPAGIGPEIVAEVLADPVLGQEARLLAIGPACEAPPDFEPLEAFEGWSPSDGHAWLRSGGTGDWEKGVASASSGQAALEALKLGADLAQARLVDALVTAPVSKEALHLSGERVEGQTQLLERWAHSERVEMLACARRLRVMPLTRHLPLLDALKDIDGAKVFQGLLFLDRELRRLGFARPKIALAGLNPHAGERGLFGTQELDILFPASERARGEGVDVGPPLPADSVFVRAAAGEFDAVLALYHDQAFIPVKLHAPGEAVTLLLGLPYVRASPAHGTAFDLAGSGRADATNLRVTVRQAVRWIQRDSSSAT